MIKKIKIGIIGGSGLDKQRFLKNFKEKVMTTPYGQPSSALICGEIDKREVVIISRHGKDHSLMPTKVPFQANIWALKEAGCSHILATTACGSLIEEMVPGDLVFVDQFIDYTKKRTLTFFEDQVIHTPMAEPFCADLRDLLSLTAKELKFCYHDKGTIITIEGPRFSTRAESLMFQSWGATVINMSTVPEVVLARELGIPYQVIAMVTDYDCWKEDAETVTWEIVMQRMEENAEKVKKLLLKVLPKIQFTSCSCQKISSPVKV